ncbi:FAD-dependent oxidoreductase [Zwartia vadi]|uniref:FAD-dependent oxidoreductase n=1 Tax=Zwartia vadi TaxID=3058168 RepID=UPI0025B401B5|nr:FAD-dependent oxidoreductase [Zwartia vadi]MDN3988245.1 FAD-dependent oxidoreductase [Zwartia vadi]
MPSTNNSKKMKFGIIGSGGSFGSKLIKYLTAFGEIAWERRGSDCEWPEQIVDWVFIASPNLYHYEQAKYFLSAGVNVFLEKPPTLSILSLENLISTAKKNNTHLYIDDVFLFRNDIALPKNLKSKENINWSKTTGKSGALLDRLTYHHLYLLNRVTNDNSNIDNIIVTSKKPALLDFTFKYSGTTICAKYEDYASLAKHIFLDIEIEPNTGMAIKAMLEYIFSGNANFYENNSTALWVLQQLTELKKHLQPRIAVVGAGLFGCTAALELSAAGYQVDLLEKQKDIIQEASAINQYRVHRGYHYPRSDATVSECLDAIPLFEKSYGQAIMRNQVKESLYAIASRDSKTSASQYLDFLNRHKLEYEVVESLPNTDLTVRVREDLFDPVKIKDIVANRLFGSGVTVKCGVQATSSLLDDYDGAIIATYSRQNTFAEKSSSYQFELVEKPIFQLPEQYRGRSIVILDGPFLCIDPYSNTPYHVMGNVVHAIHHASTGFAPEILPGYEAVLNKGVVKNPPMSKVKEFLESAKEFFPGIEASDHIGSMFTVRTVLPYRDEDDARPTVIHLLAPQRIGIFAGKICHSVAAARAARAILDEGQL